MKTRVLLIGGFNKTKSLAVSLLKKGYHVSAINSERANCEVLSEIDDLDVYEGDGSKPFVLEDADAWNADIAIALTDRDEDNLVICELCKKKFQINRTVALVSDPKKTDFFRRMGIDSVVCAVATVANIIEQQAFLDKIANHIPIGEGNIGISEIPIPATAPSVDKKLWELSLPKDVIIGCILRGDKSLVPRGDTRILAGDVLILISSAQYEAAAIKELTGK